MKEEFDYIITSMNDIIECCTKMRDEKVPALEKLSEELDKLGIEYEIDSDIEFDGAIVIYQGITFTIKADKYNTTSIVFYDCSEDKYHFSSSNEEYMDLTLKETINRIKKDIKKN